jgi:hypothetical protein
MTICRAAGTFVPDGVMPVIESGARALLRDGCHGTRAEF